MPSVTILSPVSGDTVPEAFEVYVAYDVRAHFVKEGKSGHPYKISCAVNDGLPKIAEIVAGDPAVGTRTFNFAGITTPTATIVVKLFASGDDDTPIASDTELVTVNPEPIITIINPPGIRKALAPLLGDGDDDVPDEAKFGEVRDQGAAGKPASRGRS